MSKICSSRNLSCFDEIFGELKVRYYGLKILADIDYDCIKAHENEWFGMLYFMVEILGQSIADLEVFERCLYAEKDMNTD